MRGNATIRIGGKSRPFKFGTNATDLYCKAQQITLGEFTTSFNEKKMKTMDVDPSVVRDLLYAGLAAPLLSKDEEVDFTKYTVGDWIDDMEQKELEKAFSTMIDSISKKKGVGKKK